MTASRKVFGPPKPLPIIPDYGKNAIEVKDLTFAYSNSSALVKNNVKNVLKELNLTLETGSRCLLIGANGRYVVDCFQSYKELSS
jgi:ATPase subunit of ABC transporter with duplicated ATPase domains